MAHKVYTLNVILAEFLASTGGGEHRLGEA
jgi:hypothetical protein